MNIYLGVDVGSVSTNVVAIREDRQMHSEVYIRTQGQPIRAIQRGLSKILDLIDPQAIVKGVGTTGSGRQLAATLIGADTVKNEITAHAVAALHTHPQVQTVLEIGGQDSKIIIIREGVVVDFAMNTVCAAGTGSFLDRQASRLGLAIEDLGPLSLQATKPTHIAGRCAVFAESDMVHKQQMGYGTPDIVKGLCQAMVRNYLSNVGKGKEIKGPVVFQGGVAANIGIERCFAEALDLDILVPPQHKVMGALGSALLAWEHINQLGGQATLFRGFEIADQNCHAQSSVCQGCGNQCEIIDVQIEGVSVACWGNKCEQGQRFAQVAGS